MADDRTSSEGTSTPTQPVTSQTKQAVISQPTDTTASSKPLTSTQAVVTETRTKETSNKSLSTTQPVASETATNSNVPRNDNNTTEGIQENHIIYICNHYDATQPRPGRLKDDEANAGLTGF